MPREFIPNRNIYAANSRLNLGINSAITGYFHDKGQGEHSPNFGHASAATWPQRIG
jgi:hypothetical protein